MRILGHDPALSGAAIAERGAEAVDLDTLLVQADYITLHAALTPENRRMINAAAIARMKRTAYLVNTARGGLVDADALLEALDAGHLAGAALDAFDQEPLPAEHPLRHAPRCLLTPHIAFSTRENSLDMSRRAAASVAAVLAGGRPPADVRLLNPEVFGR